MIGRMPWTQEDQSRATKKHDDLKADFYSRVSKWNDALTAGQDGTIEKGAVEDGLARWRTHMMSMQNSTEELIGENSQLTQIGILASRVADEKTVLKKLQSEGGTRADQAETTANKHKSTPSSNLLWLNRTFRSSTRLFLTIVSILFATLTVVALIYFVYASGVVQKMMAPTNNFALPR